MIRFSLTVIILAFTLGISVPAFAIDDLNSTRSNVSPMVAPPTCPQGQAYNTQTKKCECPQGQAYNTQIKKCEDVKKKQ